MTQGHNEAGQVVKSISVNGAAIQDKFLCYAMLEGARDAIQEHHRKAAEQGAVVAARMVSLPTNFNGRG